MRSSVIASAIIQPVNRTSTWLMDRVPPKEQHSLGGKGTAGRDV
jgi:hypothetical protein